MIETILSLITIVFCWLAVFFMGVHFGSGKWKFFIYGIICLVIGDIQLVKNLLTWRLVFAPSVKANVILIIISGIYLAIAFGLGYLIGRRIKVKEKKGLDKNKELVKK